MFLFILSSSWAAQFVNAVCDQRRTTQLDVSTNVTALCRYDMP